MAIPLATSASQIPALKPEGLSARGLIKTLLGHEGLFRNIADYPQAGIYERFGEEWSFCLSYNECEVHRRSYEVKGWMREVNEGKRDAGTDDDEIGAELAKRMRALTESLTLHASSFHLSRKMSQSTPPSSLFMNFYRVHIWRGSGNIPAPNGEHPSLYGPEGSPVPHAVTALDNDIPMIERILAYRLMNPFINYVCQPVKKLLDKMRRKEGEHDDGPNAVNGWIISAIAKAIVFMMATISLAAAIATLNSIIGQKVRIAVMTLFSLAFASSVQILDRDLIPIYALITSYFQVMVIFVGTTSDQTRC